MKDPSLWDRGGKSVRGGGITKQAIGGKAKKERRVVGPKKLEGGKRKLRWEPFLFAGEKASIG